MLRIPDRIHQELMNWSRWCWLGQWPHPLPATQCGSAEGEYRAPPEWDVEISELERTSRIRPNERQARIVQGAWEKLDGFPRLTLKAEYPGNDHQGYRRDRATALGLTVQQYENNLQIAINAVEAAIEAR